MPNDPSRGQSRTPPPLPKNRSQEREAYDRHKRKRQQQNAEIGKSNGGAASAAAASGSGGGGWHITTNSRCIACGRLGDSCECRGTRMDPQLKRLKVDSFLQNTPHGRCKQMKALEETGRDEARHRSRIIEQWADGISIIENAAFTCWKLLLLAQDEIAAREFGLASERKERAQVVSLANRFIVLVAVSQHERELRLRHYLSAQRQTQLLMDWHTSVMGFLGLLNREEAYRSALINQEAAARAALEGYDEELLNIMDKNERERRAMGEEFLEQQELIIGEWRRGVDAMLDMMADSACNISSMLMDRARLYSQCEQQKVQLRAVESEERRQLGDEMIREGNLVAETLRAFGQQRDHVARLEASARVALLDDVSSAYNALFLAFKRDEDEVRDIEELKRQRRESELRMALQHLSTITEEEAGGFAAILALERREKDQRYHWMLDKATQLRELEHTCVHAYRSLRDEEQHARHALVVALQESEAAVLSLIQRRARLQRELGDLAAEQKSAIGAAEHEARFALIAHMAECEQRLRHWAEDRSAAIAAAAAAETAERAACGDAEQREREGMALAAASAAERIRAAALVRDELARRAVVAAAAIAAEEANAVALLRAHAADDYARAAELARHRGIAEILRGEAAARSLVAQAEVRHRESAATRLLLERAVLEREAQEVLAGRLCAVAAAEERERELLEHEAVREAQRVAAEAQRSAEAQRAEERRAREVALAEDSRLYDPAELLGNPAPPRAADTRGALLLRELGAEAGAEALPHAAQELLARVLDAVAQRGAALRDERRRAQNAAEDAQRRAAGQRQALASAKERRAEGKEKLERDAAEHEVRTTSDRAARQRDDAQLERERARLKEKMEKLRAVQEEVASVRDTIHKQYQRR